MLGRRLFAALVLLMCARAAISQEEISNWPVTSFWVSPRAIALEKLEAAGELDTLASEGAGPAALPLTPVTPCRIVDTRGNGFTGDYGPPALVAGVARSFTLTGQCGISGAAQAVSLNITVTNTQGPGFILIYPQGGAQPTVSTLNYVAGETVANAAIVPLGAGGGVTVIAGVSGANLIIDTNGYFAPQQVVNTLNGLSGGVTLAAGPTVSITPAGNTLTIGTNATSINTPDTIVRRDGSGGFSAGGIVALSDLALSGNLTLPASSSSGGQIIQNGFPLIHTFGSNNVFLGRFAGNLTMTGSSNTATGASALNDNTVGWENTANGHAALTNNTTGQWNTAVGAGANSNNETGNSNTAVGRRALQNNMTGSFNIAIGDASGGAPTAGSHNIHIGNFGSAADSSTIRIGTSNQTRAFLAGVRGVTTGAANAIPVLIDPNGQLGTVSSSRLVKEDIRDMSEGMERLRRLRPVVFRYTTELDPSRSRQYGLIAEEVAEVFPDLAVYDAEGRPETVKYHVLPSLLLDAFQKQQQTIEDQRKEIDELKARLDRLESAGATRSRP